MHEQHESELRIALIEGLVARSEIDALRDEAGRLRRSPFDLLVERGRMSETSRADLRDALIRARAPGAPGVDSTMDMDSAPPAAPTSLGFPLRWSRYEHIRLLGEGAMGRVFLAHDPRLHRSVAIKFMRDPTPALVRRFVAEARAQARVDHPHVCKVYEVGEVEGQAYIAMQYVPGQTLDALFGELALEQKVMLMREVAEAVHAAHRAGLIHRDVKPSNILVERTSDGRLEPYVMDFGLARDWQEGMTMTGAVVGTPGYMAPEQARGEVKNLDRRADVYGLGATMYHLLTGERPIPGSNVIAVLRNVEHVEPRPLRALDRDLPSDLEAIVLQCLEKDRAARYGSARALAEDLDRFLAGEPVLARRVGQLSRLRRLAYKHRRMLAVAASALAAVVLALGWAAVTRSQLGERERLARRFTEQVERIEAGVRYSGLAPLHDTRADRQALEAQMFALAAEIRRAGDVARGPGHYALGRGHLALGEIEAAREHLERAWRRGYREPRVAYALAVVLGRLYQDGLLALARVRSAERREIEQRALAQRYRDPALDYLRRSEGADVPAAEYVAALLAYYEGRLDDALAQLGALGRRLPWFHEAPKLQGDIYAARAAERWQRGDGDGARADFEHGRRAYEAAAAIGRSDPDVYLARTELEYAALTMELYGPGDVAPRLDAGIAAATQALAAAPERYDALVLLARFQRRLAEHRMGRHDDADAAFAAALTAARDALAVAPSRPEARLELGRIWMHSARHDELRGRDPRPRLERAADAFASVPPRARDYDYHRDLGVLFIIWADHETLRGGDALTPRARAIQACRTAIELDPRQAEAWINLGSAYLDRAIHPRAPDPEADLERAITALDQARALNPRHVASHFYAALAHERLAQRQRNRGLDPGPALDRAIALHRAGIVINDQIAPLHNGLGLVMLVQAAVAWEHGRAPWPFLDQAQAAFERAMAVAPGEAYSYANMGEARLWRAVYEHALGRDPETSARAAEAALGRADELMSGQAEFLTNLARVHALRAARDLARDRDPGAMRRRGVQAVNAALAHNPEWAWAWRARGELEALRIQWRARREQVREAEFGPVVSAFEQAIELAPYDMDHRVSVARFCHWWASWHEAAGRDLEQPLTRGLAWLDEVLLTWPGHPEALALHASMLRMRAQRLAEEDEDRRAWLARARDELAAALAANPHLATHWQPERKRLDCLATTRAALDGCDH